MADSEEVISDVPLQKEEQGLWMIHPSIDPFLPKDKSRRARFDNPGWKYALWPTVTDKNSVQCLLCGHTSRGGIKHLEVVADRRATKEKKQTVIEDHFKKQEKEMVDDLVASFIYQCSLPFNIVKQQCFEVICEGIRRYGREYIPPSSHHVRNVLLEKHYENVAELKNKYLPHWTQYGVTLMTDGWTDRRGQSLLNFLVNCPEGTFFLNSVEATSEERFQTRSLLNKREDYDLIFVDDLNYSSKWMTGRPDACNEFVYEEDGFTWVEVDEAMGASELNVRPRRTSTRPLLEHGSGSGRESGNELGRGDYSISIRTYSRKSKEVVVNEEDCEDEGFKFQYDFENLMNEYSD